MTVRADRTLREPGVTSVLSLSPSRLQSVGLEDAQDVAFGLARRATLARALASLRRIDESALRVIATNTRALVWITSASHPRLAATSFYQIPRMTFVTDLAKYYLPPRRFAKKDTAYVFGENLFHEALHQQLTPRLRALRTPWGIQNIWIPWREQYWSLEHATQAAYVYAHIGELRSKWAQSEVNSSFRRTAANDAIACTQFLLTTLRPFRKRSGFSSLLELMETTMNQATRLL